MAHNCRTEGHEEELAGFAHARIAAAESQPLSALLQCSEVDRGAAVGSSQASLLRMISLPFQVHLSNPLANCEF